MLIRIRLILSLAVACLVAAVPGIARAQALDATMMEAIREADMTLAVTGFRLSTANAALCDRLEPGHGMQFHTLAQYAVDNRGLVATHFAFAGTLAVEGIVPGSPAERADIRADDSVVSVGVCAPTTRCRKRLRSTRWPNLSRRLQRSRLPSPSPSNSVGAESD